MQKLTEQETEKGLVVSYFGNSVAVETADGQVFQCHLRRNQELPVVGDRVIWQRQSEEAGVIIAIEERYSMLARGDGRQNKMKLIAANIDAVVIVMAPLPIFSEYLIDRYLIAAELLKIQPILVLNKVDLLTEASQQELVARLKIYAEIGYQVIQSSVLLPDGLQTLDTSLKGKTAVLVGPSGVGKSSIIAALSQNSVRIGDVSAKGAGKHTTTATRLYHLPGGGHLIDSPGVREFSLWSVPKKAILSGFREFKSYLSDCKFRDCQHLVEPGCAVQIAVQDAKISPQRFASYQKLMKESK